MKNNIEFYPHYTNSHEHWKFELLRVKYDWRGEGIFWALNNMIGESENTILDLNRAGKKAIIANKFKMTLEEFEEYLQYLSKECDLIIYRNGEVTTDMVKECLTKVSGKRESARERIKNYRKQKESTSEVTPNNSDVTPAKGEERKGEESKVNNIKEGKLICELKIEDCKLKKESIDFKVMESSVKLFQGFKKIFPLNKDLDRIELINWVPHVRVLMEEKKYTYDQIREVLNWAMEDNFWKTTIIDTKSLENNFEKIKIKYQNV